MGQILYLLEKINLEFFNDIDKYNGYIADLEKKRNPEISDIIDEFIEGWEDAKRGAARFHEWKFLTIMNEMVKAL